MCIILQRYATAEAAQHYSLVELIIHPHLDKKPAAFIRQVVQVHAALVLPAVG
ncbi:hypothetical protein GO988_21075 [Hymenobacter sp. HMF4947]|uniref:Uncharacterized protein n=1 Tax=Hymenobacter ginkgonis TaxID=2682976 RepID=A0A7K1TKD2_9BACT|nr:hypothetical protein [Hymenobacter ginkgonis]MVN78832.1 hypothetical protein [Hymenobacter ginkgonis]